jgi:hypothetical protein
MALNQPQYQIIQRDLSVARTAEAIVDVGVDIEALIFLEVPLGSGVQLKFGANGQFFDAEDMPSLTICPAAGTGLYMSNPAGAGTFQLFVGMADIQAAT